MKLLSSIPLHLLATRVQSRGSFFYGFRSGSLLFSLKISEESAHWSFCMRVDEAYYMLLTCCTLWRLQIEVASPKLEGNMMTMEAWVGQEEKQVSQCMMHLGLRQGSFLKKMWCKMAVNSKQDLYYYVINVLHINYSMGRKTNILLNKYTILLKNIWAECWALIYIKMINQS